MIANPALLLEVISQAARDHRDLATALRDSQLSGAASVAAALDRGQALDAALAGVIDPDVARLLSAASPDLERIARLAQGEWRLRQRQRDSIHQHVAYPLLSALIILLTAVVFLAIWPYAAAWAWLALATPPILLLVAAILLPRLGPLGERLPLAGTWHRHNRLSGVYGRAALVAQWRLTEDESRRLLGFNCGTLSAVLSRPDASDHCQHLSEHHAHRANQLAEQVGRIATLLIFASAGAVLLTLAVSEVQQYLRWCLD